MMLKEVVKPEKPMKIIKKIFDDRKMKLQDIPDILKISKSSVFTIHISKWVQLTMEQKPVYVSQ